MSAEKREVRTQRRFMTRLNERHYKLKKLFLVKKFEKHASGSLFSVKE